MENHEQITCHKVSWDQVCDLAESVAFKIKGSGFEPDVIMGIARGGLVPARILCDYLLKKQLLSITVEHWGIAKNNGKAVIRIPLHLNLEKKNVLVVDDVADTGDTYIETLNYLKSCNAKEVRTAAMHYKTSSAFVPDYWGEMQEDWKWIIYPWAVYEDVNEFIFRIIKSGMTIQEISKALKIDFGLDIEDKELEKMLNFMEFDKKVSKKKIGNEICWDANRLK